MPIRWEENARCFCLSSWSSIFVVGFSRNYAFGFFDSSINFADRFIDPDVELRWTSSTFYSSRNSIQRWSRINDQTFSKSIEKIFFRSKTKWFLFSIRSFLQLVDRVFGCLDEIFELTSRFLSDFADAKDKSDELHQRISLDEPFQNFLEVKKSKTYRNEKFVDVVRRETNTNVISNMRRRSVIVNTMKLFNRCLTMTNWSNIYEWVRKKSDGAKGNPFVIRNRPIKCSKRRVIFFRRYYICPFIITKIIWFISK